MAVSKKEDSGGMDSTVGLPRQVAAMPGEAAGEPRFWGLPEGLLRAQLFLFSS